MSEESDLRRRKRLLVASIGVATVSFLGMQTGCKDDDEKIDSIANLLAPPLDQGRDPSLTRDAATDAASARDALFPSANLLPAPGDAALDALIHTANLLAPPGDAALDAIVTTGNLVPPPLDAALDAAGDAASDGAQPSDAAPKDAKVDTGLPPKGDR